MRLIVDGLMLVLLGGTLMLEALRTRDPSKARWNMDVGFASPLNGRARWIFFIGVAGLLWGVRPDYRFGLS